uniref:F-box domain-containing protein n=1 Tax=Oryza punctata TaxID=4537 RepID=A0A0E0KC46_ORYPU
METGMAALPDDALADILGRLPARSLATSRGVCKAWRAVVDARGLLLRIRQALPHAVRGVFLNLVTYRRPRFFARRSSRRAPGSTFLPSYMGSHSPVRDHCNGLVLCGDDWVFDVANPAMRRWERLPRVDARRHVAHLVFDPATSSHYEVVLIPRVPENPDPFDLIEFFSLLDDISASDVTGSPPPDPPLDYRLTEWPPSPCTLLVFSSRTGGNGRRGRSVGKGKPWGRWRMRYWIHRHRW